jgi:hypothetical protein
VSLLSYISSCEARSLKRLTSLENVYEDPLILNLSLTFYLKGKTAGSKLIGFISRRRSGIAAVANVLEFLQRCRRDVGQRGYKLNRVRREGKP